MGDNDTRTDAKRLALLDAKRHALEQVTIYLVGDTEIRDFGLSHDEIRAYTAGIVQVVELSASFSQEGATTVARIDVTVKIDSDVVVRQIEALRQNEIVREEVRTLGHELGRLKDEVDQKSTEIATAQSKVEHDRLMQQKVLLLEKAETDGLLLQAWLALGGGGPTSTFTPGKTTAEGREAALQLVERALTQDSSYPRTYVLKGIILIEEQDYHEAAETCRRAINLLPSLARGHDCLGVALARKGDRRGAVAAYREAVRLSPSDANFHLKFAGALYLSRKFDEAIREFREAIRLKPDDISARRGLGLAYVTVEEWAKAETHLRKALQHNPNDAMVRSAQGVVLWKMGKLDEAEIELSEAIRLDPHYADGHNNLGFFLHKKGDYDQAIVHYQEALRIHPAHPYASVNLPNAIRDKESKRTAGSETVK